MKYNFDSHSEKQKILDRYILDNNSSINTEDYWDFRVTALNVELSEVANEIRFFKFWSKKPQSPKIVILEEWIDCLHFILSLSNTLEIKNFEYEIKDIDKTLNSIYIEMEKKIISLYEFKNKKNVNDIIFLLCEMAYSLQFTMDDINKSYDIKNEINFKRQKTNY